MDQVSLDREVSKIDKVRPVVVVGMDTADLGRCDDDNVGPVTAEPVSTYLVGEIQLVTCRGEDLGSLAALFACGFMADTPRWPATKTRPSPSCHPD